MIKRGLMVVAFLTVAGLLLATAAPAAESELDLSGEWVLTVLGKSPTGQKESPIRFERDGFQLQVTVSGKKGEVRSIGHVEGDAISFYYPTGGKKGDDVARFSGHVHGDMMGGELDLGKGGMTVWRASRGAESPIDLTGTWTLQMKGDSPSGLDLVPMSFRQEGANLIVTLHGDSTDVECQGSIAGKEITFFYVRAVGAEQFVAKFTGLLGGDRMGGEVDMGALGKSTWRATQDQEL